MTRERAEAMDQTSFGTMGTAEAPGKLGRPSMTSLQPGRMIVFTTVLEFIWGMSAKY